MAEKVTLTDAQWLTALRRSLSVPVEPPAGESAEWSANMDWLRTVEEQANRPAGKGRGYWHKPGEPHRGRKGTRGGSLPRGTKHYGPGRHPGTGTPQSVHGGGAQAAPAEEPNPRPATMADIWQYAREDHALEAPQSVNYADYHSIRKTLYEWKDQLKRLGEQAEQLEVWDYYRYPDEWNRKLLVTKAQIDEALRQNESAHERYLVALAEKIGLPTDLTAVDFLPEGAERNPIKIEDAAERNAYWSAMYVAASDMADKIDVTAVSARDLEALMWAYEKAAREGADDDVQTPKSQALYMFNVTLMNEMEFRANQVVSAGLETSERMGRELGYHFEGEYQPLPEVLYHVATAKDAILNDRLRSRHELSQHLGKGLGGGSDKTISFTTSLETAKNIERTLHEAHAVLNGKLTIRHLIAMAEDGQGAERSFIEDMIGGDYSLAPGKPSETSIRYWYQKWQDIDDGTYSKDLLGDKLIEMRWDFYRKFLSARQNAGGYEDPLFFGTDWKGLRALDPSQFAVLKVTPNRRPGLKSQPSGIQMSSLAEWRIVGADAVRIVEVLDFYKPGRVSRYTGRRGRGS